MSNTRKIDVKDGDTQGAFRALLTSILELADIRAVLVPLRPAATAMAMPTLVSDPEALDAAAPLAPSFPLNAAKVISKLSRKPFGGKIAAVLRPCEIRAFVELVKLKQGRMEDVVVIGADCPGAFANGDYLAFAAEADPSKENEFVRSALNDGQTAFDGRDLMAACLSCEHPTPDGADIRIGLLGMDTKKELMVQAGTEAGTAILSELGLTDFIEPSGRAAAVEKLVGARTAVRDGMFAETAAQTDSLEKLSDYLSGCVNCYNCRVACPVCYCKECVFLTEAFNHDPSQYLRWAERKGAVKMPADTVFYHMTRMAHMSLACVGCGQCSNACPNGIPLVELFRTVAHHTQIAFGYEAGRSVEEKPPMSEFRESEFQEVVGME